MGKYFRLILISIITLSINCCFSRISLLTSSQGAIGKCTSLFKFFGSIMNNCVGKSSAITAGVQSDLADQ